MSKYCQDDFTFENALSKKGKPVIYIRSNTKKKFTEKEKRILKKICGGYFFYSPTKRMYGFSDRGNQYESVKNFLFKDIIPEEIRYEIYDEFKDAAINTEHTDLETEISVSYVNVKGRPLFYTDPYNGGIKVTINTKHWFFKNQSKEEKEIAAKIIVSLIKSKLMFTSELVDGFFMKLHAIQQIEFEYEQHT